MAPRVGDTGAPRPTVEARGTLGLGEYTTGAAPPKSGSGNKSPGPPKACTANPGLVKTAIMSCVIKGCRILINNGITWWWDRAREGIMTDCGKMVRLWLQPLSAPARPGEVAGPAFQSLIRSLGRVLRVGWPEGRSCVRSKPVPPPTSHLLHMPQPHPQIPGRRSE